MDDYSLMDNIFKTQRLPLGKSHNCWNIDHLLQTLIQRLISDLRNKNNSLYDCNIGFSTVGFPAINVI